MNQMNKMQKDKNKKINCTEINRHNVSNSSYFITRIYNQTICCFSKMTKPPLHKSFCFLVDSRL